MKYMYIDKEIRKYQPIKSTRKNRSNILINTLKKIYGKDYLVEFNKDIKPLIITFGGIGGGIHQPLVEFKNFLLKI